MKYLYIISFIFCLNAASGQKTLDIPSSDIVNGFLENLPATLEKFGLEDLRESTDSLNVRIWRPQEIFTLKIAASITCKHKYYTFSMPNGDYTLIDDKPIIYTSDFSENISQQLLDLLVYDNLATLKDDTNRGMDGYYVILEIATSKTYKVVSYWSPKETRSKDCAKVVEILQAIRKEFDSDILWTNFLNTLKPGEYLSGMSYITVDNLPENNIEKTDFYYSTENIIRNRFTITPDTNHTDYPLILINNKRSNLADLNLYTQKDILSFNTISADDSMRYIYGTRAENGVVLVFTK